MNKELINKICTVAKDKGFKHVTKKDIHMYLNCKIKESFEEMQQTKLYIKYGSEYCHMLEIANRLM